MITIRVTGGVLRHLEIYFANKLLFSKCVALFFEIKSGGVRVSCLSLNRHDSAEMLHLRDINIK